MEGKRYFPQKIQMRICLNIETSSETETRNLNILPEIAYHSEMVISIIYNFKLFKTLLLAK